MVERRLIESILEEKKMWQTGAVSLTSVTSLNRLLGVEAVVLGTLADSPEDNTTEVSARVVRVGTGEIIFSGTVIAERSWPDKPALPKIAQARVPVPTPVLKESFGAQFNPTEKIPFPAKLSSNKLSIDGRKKPGPYEPSAIPLMIPTNILKTSGGVVR